MSDDMNDDDVSTMVLARATEWHTARSFLIDADCGHRCWISPESAAHVENSPEIRTACLPCSGIDIEKLKAGEVPNVKAVPGQREALTEHWGEEETNKAFKQLGVEE